MNSESKVNRPRRFATLIVITAVVLVCLGLIWTLYNLKLGRIAPSGTELVFSFVDEVPADVRDAMNVVRIRLADRRPLAAQLIDDRISVKFRADLTDHDIERMRMRIEKVGRIGFHLVSDDERDQARAGEGAVVPGYAPYVAQSLLGEEGTYFRRVSYEALPALNLSREDWAGESKAMLVTENADVSGDRINADSLFITEDMRGLPAVGFQFTPEGKVEFAEFTEENIGRRVAIIIDDILLNAPVVQARVYGMALISFGGQTEPALAEDILHVLRSGEMPVALRLESINRPERTQ